MRHNIHTRRGLVLKHAVDKVSNRQMHLFHAVYVNGKIPAVAGCQISDPITGVLYYAYIFSTRISQLKRAIIYYDLIIVFVVITISTMLSVIAQPKTVASLGTWFTLLSGCLLIDSGPRLMSTFSVSLSRFIHSIITSRVILDIKESMVESDSNCGRSTEICNDH